MIRSWGLLALVAAALPAGALAPLERARGIAAEIGAPLAKDVVLVYLAAPESKALAQKEPPSAQAGHVRASGTFSGSGFLTCTASANGTGLGRMSGTVALSATLTASGPNDASGVIAAATTVSLSGACQRQSGHVSGTALVAGRGELFGPDGKSRGTVLVSGTLTIHRYAASRSVSISEYASLTGRLDAPELASAAQ